jgi:subtilisin family serine protease
MVIDNGIDPSHPVFQGKVVASYTIHCEEKMGGAAAPDGGASPDGVEAVDAALLDAGAGAADAGDAGAVDARSFDEARTALLAELAQPDESCQLRAGIAPRPNPFADLEGDRGRWNTAIHGNRLVGNMFRPSPLDGLHDRILERLAKVPFHGTATAGLVATENPGAHLVLIEVPLLSADEAMAQFTCLTQPSIDETVALLSDPEVRSAFLSRPPATVDRALDDIMTMYQVGIVNESYGPLSRFGVEELQFRKSCPEVALKTYFQVKNELDRAYEDAHPGPPVLVAKAAGNDGALVNGPTDSDNCRIGGLGQLLVGSYGYDGEHSRFTNFGACVDVYAPGEDVVVPLPGGWVFPLSGTSFAAPLVARLLSLDSPSPFHVAGARAAVLALREPNRNIPLARFPPAVIYDPRPKAPPKGSALTLAAPPETPVSAVPLSALHQALWPIRWVEGHAR